MVQLAVEDNCLDFPPALDRRNTYRNESLRGLQSESTASHQGA